MGMSALSIPRSTTLSSPPRFWPSVIAPYVGSSNHGLKQAPRINTMTAAAPKSCAVAVIGAGAAGLAAARELHHEGHHVTVFESERCLGGVWAYHDSVESDPLGRDPGRKRVHSSMYRHLRTNLPRQIMGFSDFPFDPWFMGEYSRDSRQYCSHQEVQAYLEAFAVHFNLPRLVQFSCQVERIRPIGAVEIQNGTLGLELGGSAEEPATMSNAPRWEVQIKHTGEGAAGGNGTAVCQEFDAVVVCNGHYSEPKLPEIDGMEAFPGRQMHAHNYRTNDAFTGQVVVVVGASSSGDDISREITQVAAEVYLSARTWKPEDLADQQTPIGQWPNLWRRAMLCTLGVDGSATFADGSRCWHVDTVVYCTGYNYSFPFLEGTDIVRTTNSHVYPLYQHMFPPPLAPSLSFVGLCWKVVPFPQFELQSKLIARLLSGRAALPTRAAMQKWVADFFAQLKARDVPLRYTHMQNFDQWQYNDELARMCGGDVDPTPAWRADMYTKAGQNKRANPEVYRDLPVEGEPLELARKEFETIKAKVAVMRAAVN